MGASLSRFDGSAVRSASAGFGAVAAAGTDLDIFQAEHQLVVVSGRARFADADLAALAQHHGVARALAEGYARKGSDVIATLSVLAEARAHVRLTETPGGAGAS